MELYTGDDIEIDKKIEDVLIKKGEMATCKIITKYNNGTGFFCKIPLYNQLIKFLFTSNHIINKDLIKTGNNIHFVYKLKRKKIKIADNRKCFINEDLDYTCIEIFDEDEIEDFFDVENKEYKDINEYFLNEDIAIIQYPKGGPLKINAGHLKEINENMIKHKVSTDYGSSGAPIILYERNYEILGIHRGRNIKLNINMGIYIKFIIEDIKKNIDVNVNLISGINSGGAIIYSINKEKDNIKELCNVYVNGEKINSFSPIGEFCIVFNDILTDTSWMFCGCSSLTSLNLSNFNTTNVKSMNGMFYNCYCLTSLNLSNFNTTNVKSMNGMFYNYYCLTSLNLSNFNTNNVKSMNSMFRDCSSLTSLNLSNFNTNNVKSMSCMFYGCSSLTSLNLSNFNIFYNKDDMFEGLNKKMQNNCKR